MFMDLYVQSGFTKKLRVVFEFAKTGIAGVAQDCSKPISVVTVVGVPTVQACYCSTT